MVPAPLPAAPRWGLAAMMVATAAMVVTVVGSMALDRHALLERGARVEAVVLRVETAGGRRSGHYPVYRFTTAQGEPVEAGSRVSVPRNRMEAGDRVMVVHDSTNPAHVRDAEGFDADTGLGPWLWGPFALALIAGAVMVVRWPHRVPP